MGRLSFGALAGVAALVVVAGGCRSGSSEGEAEVSLPGGSLLVAGGEHGVAVVHGAELRPIRGLEGSPFAYGPIAVPFDEDSVAIDGKGKLAIASADGRAVVVECPDCAGVAMVGRELVTTRRNLRPGEGFDILRYDERLELQDAVAARRVAERVGTPLDENGGAPVTLAATGERVTVGYLSVAGGARSGPSIIAQHGADGELLDSVEVDGLLGRSAVSPDGRFLAFGLNSAANACSPIASLAVLRLDGLDLLDTEPDVPAEVLAEFEGPGAPWFRITDLVWDGDVVLAAGEVYRTGWAGQGTDCEEPELWRRAYDTATGEFTDLREARARARRGLGSGCDDAVEVRGRPYEDALLVAVVGGDEEELGPYQTLSLGRPVGLDC